LFQRSALSFIFMAFDFGFSAENGLEGLETR
jgi:hypothetical protein